MITDRDIGDGVESHAQQAEFGRLRNDAGPEDIEAEDFVLEQHCGHARDACPAVQAGGGKDVLVRAGRQQVYVLDIDNAFRSRVRTGLPAPAPDPASLEERLVPLCTNDACGFRLPEIRRYASVRADKLRQFGECPVDMRIDLVWLRVDQARRDTGDYMLECSAPL